MLLRKTVQRATFSNPEPAAWRTAARFFRTRSVCAAISPGTSRPVAASSATRQAVNTNPPALIACEYGPMALGASGVEITSRMESSRVLALRTSDCRRAHLVNQMRSHHGNEFARRYDFCFLPKLGKMTLVARHKVIGFGGIGALEEDVVVRVSSNLKSARRKYEVAVCFEELQKLLLEAPADMQFRARQHVPIF